MAEGWRGRWNSCGGRAGGWEVIVPRTAAAQALATDKGLGIVAASELGTTAAQTQVFAAQELVTAAAPPEQGRATAAAQWTV